MSTTTDTAQASSPPPASDNNNDNTSSAVPITVVLIVVVAVVLFLLLFWVCISIQRNRRLARLRNLERDNITTQHEEVLRVRQRVAQNPSVDTIDRALLDKLPVKIYHIEPDASNQRRASRTSLNAPGSMALSSYMQKMMKRMTGQPRPRGSAPVQMESISSGSPSPINNFPNITTVDTFVGQDATSRDSMQTPATIRYPNEQEHESHNPSIHQVQSQTLLAVAQQSTSSSRPDLPVIITVPSDEMDASIDLNAIVESEPNANASKLTVPRAASRPISRASRGSTSVLDVISRRIPSWLQLDRPPPPESSLCVCSICLDDFSEGDELRELPCHHWFHVTCIDGWLLECSVECPMCKRDVRSPFQSTHEDGSTIVEGASSPNLTDGEQMQMHEITTRHIAPL